MVNATLERHLERFLYLSAIVLLFFFILIGYYRVAYSLAFLDLILFGLFATVIILYILAKKAPKPISNYIDKTVDKYDNVIIDCGYQHSSKTTDFFPGLFGSGGSCNTIRVYKKDYDGFRIKLESMRFFTIFPPPSCLSPPPVLILSTPNPTKQKFDLKLMLLGAPSNIEDLIGKDATKLLDGISSIAVDKQIVVRVASTPTKEKLKTMEQLLLDIRKHLIGKTPPSKTKKV